MVLLYRGQETMAYSKHRKDLTHAGLAQIRIYKNQATERSSPHDVANGTNTHDHYINQFAR